jgi:uncharacterized membrane protein YfcA
LDGLGYLLTILMGVSLGLVGGGGSILTVPILVYIFAIPPVLATGYSLFLVGVTSAFGGVFYARKGEIDLKVGAVFTIPSFAGVYFARAVVIPRLPEVFYLGPVAISKSSTIMVVLASLMLIAALGMLRSGKSKVMPVSLSTRARTIAIASEGAVVGLVTGFVGAGGGFLIIPVLVMIVGLEMRKAVGTSLLIIAVKSLLGFLGDVQHQAVLRWDFVIGLTALSLVGLLIGLAIGPRVPEERLKKGFGYFVLLMGIGILVERLAR